MSDEITLDDSLLHESITLNGSNVSMEGVVEDIKMAHQELDEYKQGALAITQALDEKINEVDELNKPKRDALQDLRESAFAIYLRVHRGDLELTGHREGEYSGFMESEEE